MRAKELKTKDVYFNTRVNSDGSPISPVFKKPEDLANWMINNDNSITKKTTYEQWVKFITDVEWCPTMMGNGSQIKSGTEII